MTVRDLDEPYRRRGVVVVYALVDPRSTFPRYVGQSCEPNARLVEHRTLSKTGNDRTDRGLWIEELRNLRLRPVLKNLEDVLPDKADATELWWTEKFIDEGFHLLNTTVLLRRGKVQIKIDAEIEKAFFKIENVLSLSREEIIREAVLKMASLL